MIDVISVRFRNRGKSYFFDPNGLPLDEGQSVIVETSKGLEFGDCVSPVHAVEDSSIVPPLRPVVRIATEEDMKTAEQNRKKEQDAFPVCEDKILRHGLDMKLVDVEYSFDGSKILFFFTSDGRVDFRELVKDLAATFRARIELRQIGVRDSAKMLGGLGICGRPFCCSSFLEEFQPVSIKMAKTQSLSLNPTKISGTCGRLMCCLKYEQDAYEDLIKNLPKVDAEVDTPKGKGTVTEVNLLRRTLKVRLADAPEGAVQSYHADSLGYTVGGSYKPPCQEEPAPTPLSADTPELGYFGEGKVIGSYRTPGDSADTAQKHRSQRRSKGFRENGDAAAEPAEARSEGQRSKGDFRPRGDRSRAENRQKGEFRPKNEAGNGQTAAAKHENKPKGELKYKGENRQKGENRSRAENKPRGEFKPKSEFKPKGENRPQAEGTNPEAKPRGEFKPRGDRRPHYPKGEHKPAEGQQAAASADGKQEKRPHPFRPRRQPKE